MKFRRMAKVLVILIDFSPESNNPSIWSRALLFFSGLRLIEMATVIEDKSLRLDTQEKKKDIFHFLRLIYTL